MLPIKGQDMLPKKKKMMLKKKNIKLPSKNALAKKTLRKKPKYLGTYSLMLVDPDMDLIHMFHQPITSLEYEDEEERTEEDDDDLD